jgi:hypothetical protein
MGPYSVPLQYQHLRFGHSSVTGRGFPGLPDPVDILFDALFGKIILFGIKFKIFNSLLNKILSIVEKSIVMKPCELKFAGFLTG